MGTGLVLPRPQSGLAKVLEIIGADHMITLRAEIEGTPEPEATAGVTTGAGSATCQCS